MTPAQREIIEDVARRYDLTVADLLSKCPAARISHPRQEAMYLLRKTGRWSTPMIGRVLGGRDHTTILYGVRRHAERSGLENIQRTHLDCTQLIETVHRASGVNERIVPRMEITRRAPAPIRPRPTRKDVERRVEQAAQRAGLGLHDVLGSDTGQEEMAARKAAWRALIKDGFSVQGIADVWGCDCHGPRSVKRELDAQTKAEAA